MNGLKNSPISRNDPLRRAKRSIDPAPQFPFGRLVFFTGLLAVGGMFIYRLSETGGQMSQTACLSAAAVSLLSALVGIIPVVKTWRRELLWVLLGFFLSGIIRLLIGTLGVVIIILFTKIQRIQFIGYLALFYTAFLAADTWLALWILQNTRIQKQETAVHGTIWDIIGKS
ncbi:MAG: hypothetical protein KBI46_05935 [Phycisphaerae bacterium]|nr:hypothetical protein [Phycisphaerae bacterium]